MLWTVILYVKEIDSLLRKSVNYIFKHHSCYRAVYQTFYRLKCFIGWKKVKNGTNLIPLCVDFSATKNKFKYRQYTTTPPQALCGFYIIDIRETAFIRFSKQLIDVESLKRYQKFIYSTIILFNKVRMNWCWSIIIPIMYVLQSLGIWVPMVRYPFYYDIILLLQFWVVSYLQCVIV